MRHTQSVIRALTPLFFVSGATALAYQVIWMRELQLVFGTSTFAVASLLAAFMAGLAGGGFALARYADRLKRPLLVYGVLELGIGLYALAFPWLLKGATPLYLAAWRVLAPAPAAFGTLQFGLVAVLLALPTAAMGATLPLLARFTTLRLGDAGSRVGTLYAVNTFGAVAGTWLCGFLLLPAIGVALTTLAAAMTNLLLGALALGLERWGGGRALPASDDPAIDAPPAPVLAAVCVAIGLAGFSALTYEVAWTRLLALMLGSAAYTFAVMLIAFLAGIALGGKLGGRYADRVLQAGGRQGLLYRFAAVEVGIAVLAYLTMYLYPELPYWYVQLFDRLGVAQRPEVAWWISLILAGLVMTLPAVLMGMHLPMAARAVSGDPRRLGRPVGIVYGVNSLGAAAGAFLAGFVLLPNLGLQGTILVAVAAGLVAAAVLSLPAAGGSLRRAALAPTAVLAAVACLVMLPRPPWNPLLMTAGMYQYVSNLDDHSRAGVRHFSIDLFDLEFYEEGLSSVVTVAQNKGSMHRWLAVNGKVDASTTDDMPTQVLLSLLPMQFVSKPADVLVIGLASGVTAGAASLLPDVEKLQIVELEPAIERAARFFDDWNHSVLSDPRVDVVHNDGRNQLLLSAPASYDMIVSEPSNPWISGVANLFTREFLEIGKSRLKPGGIWSQWVPIYGMDSNDLQTILKTFAEVYPYVHVYATIEYADLVLTGSDAPMIIDERQVSRLLKTPGVTAELQRGGVNSTADLLSRFLMNRDDIVALTSGLPVNTDDNMYIEYSTATKLHLDARRDNFALLLQHASLPELAPSDDANLWVGLARSYRRHGEAARSIDAMSRATTLLADKGDGL